MQINNFANNTALVTTADPAVKTRRENQQEIESPSREDQSSLPVQELFQRGELRQLERIDALERSENLTLQAREALEQFQSVEDASREFDGGELLGVDITV